MKTFQYTCVDIAEFCDAHDLDIYAVDDVVNASDISWGTNEDTLVSYKRLCKMMDVVPLREYNDTDIMVSLGA
jgi:hypothetical protein